MEALGNGNTGTKKRVAYFYDAEIGNYHYGQGHPMKVRLFVCLNKNSKYISLTNVILVLHQYLSLCMICDCNSLIEFE
jgi:hypothetical protein